MKGKAIARQGFYGVYLESDGEPLRRLQPAAYIYQLAVSSPSAWSALRTRITRFLSQETAQVEDSHPRWFVQPSANCRNLGVASALAASSFQLLTSGALIAT
jgi:hypothetical protein